MPLGNTYDAQVCSIAKSLEIVGERWTLLIIRDAVFGARKFSEFQEHLEIPKAVLTQRLKSLVAEEVLVREKVAGHFEYVLTEKGQALWPVVSALAIWGSKYYAENGPWRSYRHGVCGSPISGTQFCTGCEHKVPLAEIEQSPTAALLAAETRQDLVTQALLKPRLLLSPIS